MKLTKRKPIRKNENENTNDAIRKFLTKYYSNKYPSLDVASFIANLLLQIKISLIIIEFDTLTITTEMPDISQMKIHEI